MKIEEYKNSNITFKSGLKPLLKEAIIRTNVENIERAFLNDYGIDAQFNGSKFYAFGFGAVLNIFEEITHKFKLKFGALPPSIRIYRPQELIIKYDADNFCLPRGGWVLADQKAFAKRSIFMKYRDDVQNIDQELNKAFQKRLRSSSHFLSEIIHEWLHNIHLSMQSEYFTDKFSPNDRLRKTIQETIGSYAANSRSKSEIFAEGITKTITSALDYNSLHVKHNPLDELKKFPREIVEIIEKEL